MELLLKQKYEKQLDKLKKQNVKYNIDILHLKLKDQDNEMKVNGLNSELNLQRTKFDNLNKAERQKDNDSEIK